MVLNKTERLRRLCNLQFGAPKSARRAARRSSQAKRCGPRNPPVVRTAPFKGKTTPAASDHPAVPRRLPKARAKARKSGEASELEELIQDRVRHLLIKHTVEDKDGQSRRRLQACWDLWKISPFSTEIEVLKRWVCILGISPGSFESYLSCYKTLLTEGYVDEDGCVTANYSAGMANLLRKTLGGEDFANGGMSSIDSAIKFFRAVFSPVDDEAKWKFFSKGIAYLNPAGSSRIRAALPREDALKILRHKTFKGAANILDSDAIKVLCAFGFRPGKLREICLHNFIEERDRHGDRVWMYIGDTHKRKASIGDDEGCNQRCHPDWAEDLDAVFNRATTRYEVRRRLQRGRAAKNLVFAGLKQGYLRDKLKATCAALNFNPDLIWTLHSGRSGGACDAALLSHERLHGKNAGRPDLADRRIIADIKEATAHKSDAMAMGYAAPNSARLKKAAARRQTILNNQTVLARRDRGSTLKPGQLPALPKEYWPWRAAVEKYEKRRNKGKKTSKKTTRVLKRKLKTLP
jgi:hypothetical protein